MIATEEQRASIRLLMIDDEADYATLNTEKDEKATTTNALVRAILGLFPHRAYVGYTATPYANFFISKRRDAK